jgi:hypothetical protein
MDGENAGIYDTVSAKRQRKVFGRVNVVRDGKRYTFEQRPDGVYFRRHYGRKWAKVQFDLIIDFHFGQFRLGIPN